MTKDFFPSLAGNGKLKTRLFNMISDKTLPHAFILYGPDGCGRHTLARLIAQALNCRNASVGGFSLPCGICDACRRIAEGNFTDVKILSKPSSRASIGVDDIRLFREDMFLSPTESDRKIYIIENSELLTVQAQNALLKVMEEPPEGVLLMLLCNSTGKLLTTVRSRAQLMTLERLPDDLLRTWLIEKNESAALLARIAPDDLQRAVLRAEGVLGRVIDSLSDSARAEARKETERVIALLDAASPGAPARLSVEVIRTLPAKRPELVCFLEAAQNAVRDILILKFDPDASPSFFTEKEQPIAYAGKFSKQQLLRLSDLLKTAAERVLSNGNIRAVLTVFGSSLKS